MVYFGCIIFYLLLIVVDHDGASGSFVSNISFATRTDIATATEEEYSKVWSWARIESLNLNGIDGETNTVDRSNSYSQGDSFDQLSTISNNRKVNEAMRSRSEMMNSVKYPCNIQKIDLRLSKKGVRSERDISRLPETPVIYVGWPDRNIFLSLLTSKTNMTLSPNG